MQIVTIAPFLEYFENIRQRTKRALHVVPPEQIEWRPRESAFSIGDLARHIASIERYMYAENAQFLPSKYPGHGKELADGYPAVLEFMERAHGESMEIFSRLQDADLQKKCMTPAGTPITLWKWLRAMTEHEVHHRGQIYLYLALLGISGPPLFGLTSEEVRARSTGS